MIRAVVDTNIIVRAIIKPKGTVGPVLQHLRKGHFTLLYTEGLLTELVDVLNRPRIRNKYNLSQEDIEIVLALILLRGEPVNPTRRIDACRDPKDNMFLEAAISARANTIVSGDEDLLTLHPFEGIPIIRPAAFLSMLDEDT